MFSLRRYFLDLGDFHRGNLRNPNRSIFCLCLFAYFTTRESGSAGCFFLRLLLNYWFWLRFRYILRYWFNRRSRSVGVQSRSVIAREQGIATRTYYLPVCLTRSNTLFS